MVGNGEVGGVNERGGKVRREGRERKDQRRKSGRDAVWAGREREAE